MTIERATIEDAAEILALQKLAFQSQAELYDDYTLPPLLQTLEELRAEFDTRVILRTTRAGSIAGSVRGVVQNGACHVGRLVVHPDWQNQGIGARLMREIEGIFREAPSFQLFTGHRSAATIHLYRKLGYEIYREEPLSELLTLVYMEKRNHAGAELAPDRRPR